MDRKNFYFDQELLEADMDDAFEQVEKAIDLRSLDGSNSGVVSGFTITPTIGTDHTVVVGQGISYDTSGKRAKYAGSVSVDLSLDSTGASALPSSGHYRWVTLCIRYGKHLTSPATDGLGNTVYFNRLDSFNANGVTLSDDLTAAANEVGDQKFFVIAGTEATIGSGLTMATPPGDAVILCDVLMTFGDHDVANLSIFYGRRPYFAMKSNNAMGFPAPFAVDGGNESLGNPKFPRRLLWEIEGGFVKTRFYVGKEGLEIVTNAAWNGTTSLWTADSTTYGGATATKFTYGGVLILQKFTSDLATPWTDAEFTTAGWDSRMLLGSTATQSGWSAIGAHGNIISRGAMIGYISGEFPTKASAFYGVAIQFRRQFLATPSSVTFGAAGANEANVSGPGNLNQFSLNPYGVHISWNAIDVSTPGYTRIDRQYTATY